MRAYLLCHTAAAGEDGRQRGGGGPRPRWIQHALPPSRPRHRLRPRDRRRARQLTAFDSSRFELPFPWMCQSIDMFQQPSTTASTKPMKTISSVGVLLLGFLFHLAGAQQFSDLYTTPYEVLGLSKACTDVLNTRVSCDIALALSTRLSVFPFGACPLNQRAGTDLQQVASPASMSLIRCRWKRSACQNVATTYETCGPR